jgi:hypothetical protein
MKVSAEVGIGSEIYRMKRISGILIFTLFLGMGSCFDPPEFSNIPSITFEDVRVQEVPGATNPDSLIVTISFRDGDGNIGIDGSENSPPFHERWYFLQNPSPTCEGIPAPCTKIHFVDQGNLNNYVTYKLRRQGAPYDTLPAFVRPFDCLNYRVLKNENNTPIDTVYTQLNPRYNNFFVEVWVKNGADFQKYDFNQAPYPDCEIYGLDGRLPILAKDRDVSLKLPLEGVITYKVTSASFGQLIGKTLKLWVWIMDRDGNISRKVESKEFVLN